MKPSERWISRSGRAIEASPVERALHEVYDLRNDFAHGNEIDKNNFCYRQTPTNTDLLKPCFFFFRKLIVSHAAEMECINFDYEEPRTVARMTQDERNDSLRGDLEVASRRNLEKEYDALIAKLLTHPAWWNHRTTRHR